MYHFNEYQLQLSTTWYLKINKIYGMLSLTTTTITANFLVYEIQLLNLNKIYTYPYVNIQ